MSLYDTFITNEELERRIAVEVRHVTMQVDRVTKAGMKDWQIRVSIDVAVEWGIFPYLCEQFKAAPWWKVWERRKLYQRWIALVRAA